MNFPSVGLIRGIFFYYYYLFFLMALHLCFQIIMLVVRKGGGVVERNDIIMGDNCCLLPFTMLVVRGQGVGTSKLKSSTYAHLPHTSFLISHGQSRYN
jgi:hypothetical protein